MQPRGTRVARHRTARGARQNRCCHLGRVPVSLASPSIDAPPDAQPSSGSSPGPDLVPRVAVPESLAGREHPALGHGEAVECWVHEVTVRSTASGKFFGAGRSVDRLPGSRGENWPVYRATNVHTGQPGGGGWGDDDHGRGPDGRTAADAAAGRRRARGTCSTRGARPRGRRRPPRVRRSPGPSSPTRRSRAGRVVESYAYARVGYHRGLDLLRRNGWKGHGPVPWEHEPNRGLPALPARAGPGGRRDRRGRRGRALRDFLRDSSPGGRRRSSSLSPLTTEGTAVPAIVLVGAQWGDEGKGKATDLLGGRGRLRRASSTAATTPATRRHRRREVRPAPAARRASSPPACVPVIGNGVVIDLGGAVRGDRRARGARRRHLARCSSAPTRT